MFTVKPRFAEKAARQATDNLNSAEQHSQDQPCHMHWLRWSANLRLLQVAQGSALRKKADCEARFAEVTSGLCDLQAELGEASVRDFDGSGPSHTSGQDTGLQRATLHPSSHGAFGDLGPMGASGLPGGPVNSSDPLLAGCVGILERPPFSQVRANSALDDPEGTLIEEDDAFDKPPPEPPPESRPEEASQDKSGLEDHGAYLLIRAAVASRRPGELNEAVLAAKKRQKHWGNKRTMSGERPSRLGLKTKEQTMIGGFSLGPKGQKKRASKKGLKPTGREYSGP